jgi:hypothetical protein
VSLVAASWLAFASPHARAQPDEIRIRALGVPDRGTNVEARDLLGDRGVVIRDVLPGQFASRLARPVGDVNGDGFSDLTVFWGAIGDVEFEELYLVFGGAELPERIDRSNIAQFSSRFLHADPDFGDFGAVPRTAPAGDVDGDGFADFFIGLRKRAPREYADVVPDDGASYQPGVVYLIYGGAEIPSENDIVHPSESLRMVGFSSRKPNVTKLGEAMCSGGDLNGDGIADLVFAAPNAQADNGTPGVVAGPGRVYVLFGRKDPYAGLVDLEEIGSSLAGMILQGNTLGQGFGMEVSFVGDVNGDAIDDLVVGVTRLSGSQPVPDHVALLYGAQDLPARLTADEIVRNGYGIRILRTAAASDGRQSFSSLGDINRDGMVDLLIGSPGDNQGHGSAYVVFGQDFASPQIDLPQLARMGAAVRFDGEVLGKFSVSIDASMGQALSSIDYDRDGNLDLLLGSPRVPVDGVHQVGQVYVVRGPFEPGIRSLGEIRTGALAGALLTSEIPEWLGLSVHNLGDVNGDAAEDILIAGPYVHGTSPNHIEPGLSPDPTIYVVFGSGGKPLPLKVDEVSPGIAPLGGGTEVTILGQGYDGDVRVAVGGRAAKVLRVETSARLVVEVPEGDSLGLKDVLVERVGEGVLAQALFRYVSPYYPDVDVRDVAPSRQWLTIDAGPGRTALLDHNADGLGDVFIESADGLIVLYGSETPVAGTNITVVPGRALPQSAARLRLSDQEGHEPFTAGDVNGDGISDLAIVSQSVVTVVFGGKRFRGDLEVAALLETGDAALVSISGARKPSVSGGADLDGDGIGDLLLYRPLEVHVVRGRRLWPPLRGLALEPVFRSAQASSEDGNRFGSAAAIAGDIDGDGLSELLIGAPGLNWLHRGNGFLVFGKSDWGSEVVEELVESGEALQIDSVKDKDSLGFRVTAVGDFSGDGIPDFSLSAQAGSLEFAGESYVIFGNDGLRGAPSLDLAQLGERGLRIRGEFGFDEAVDIAPAGDFNGDGRRDLLISAGNITTADNPFPSRSFVVFGGARGLLDLGKLQENGFRIHVGERAQSVGAIDFNGDGFDDVVVRGGALLFVIFGSGVESTFIRGDSNRSGGVDLSDAVATLNYLFLGTSALACKDAADADDSGRLELTDAVYLLAHLFLGKAEPPPPFPTPGPDPTGDSLSCRG